MSPARWHDEKTQAGLTEQPQDEPITTSASTTAKPADSPDATAGKAKRSLSARRLGKTLTIWVTVLAGVATIGQLLVSLDSQRNATPDATPDAAPASEPTSPFAGWGATRDEPGLRASGQSRLMDATLAGQQGCDPSRDTRPFVIEWDATDMSSFESIAASDVVIVAYDGCELRVLDACRNDSIRGSLGTYRSPEWTSGSLETIDIHDTAELRTTLPLGHASLGERVAAGEQFHMEYFVAGTVHATRTAVYREALPQLAGCASATHFVYGYNLGAFALGSSRGLETEVGASVFGFGSDGRKGQGRSAEKRGGDLSTCQSERVAEVAGCKTPIRLNLREIVAGSDPSSETNNPATLDALELSKAVQRMYESAMQNFFAGDGAGCLADLDAHDQINPEFSSKDPKTHRGGLRAKCLMLSGDCEAGKSLLRQNLAVTSSVQADIDDGVQQSAVTWCQGDAMSDRDQLLQAAQRLQDGAYSGGVDTQACEREWQRARLRLDKVAPRDNADHWLVQLDRRLWNTAPRCLGRAGDCERAYAVFVEAWPADLPHVPDETEADLRKQFESAVRECVPPP